MKVDGSDGSEDSDDEDWERVVPGTSVEIIGAGAKAGQRIWGQVLQYTVRCWIRHLAIVNCMS